MLRKIRTTLAIVFFTGITLLFLDFTGTIHRWLHWMAHIQLVPALLFNAALALIPLLLTLMFGRIYCSVICPLGVFQDAVAWLTITVASAHIPIPKPYHGFVIPYLAS